MSKFEIPSVCSFSRSIQPSLGYFYAKNETNLEPIGITTENLRATFSDFSSSKKRDEFKLADGNIHKVESAYLPAGFNTLLVKYSVKSVANMLKPENINNEDAARVFEKFSELYVQRGGVDHLSELYVRNIVSGKPLWRNLTIADGAKVKVSFLDKEFSFDVPKELSESFFEKYKNEIKEISSYFAEGLKSYSKFSMLYVENELFVGEGQEVFPSQEFIDKDRVKDAPDRTLSSRVTNGVRQAIFHDAKIGNAIRTIDTWYEDSDSARALAVEPFGIDRDYSVAVRFRDKTDFYSLVSKHINTMIEDMTEGKPLTGKEHFVAACLIRGGVFSGDSKKG